MVDTSPGAAPREPGSPATPAGGRRQQARPWRPQRFAALRSGAKPRRRGRLRARRERGRWLRRCSSQGRGDGRAAGAGGGQPSAGCGRRRGPAEVPRTISRLAAGCPRGAPWSALRGSLRRAPAGGRRQGARRASEPEGTVPSGGVEGRDQRNSAAPLLAPARGEPRGGRRKRSRRPLLPPLEPGAPAGEAGEVVPRDFGGGGARAGAGGQADVGRGCEPEARGL